MASSEKNNTIKIAVAVVALIVAIALPIWYFTSNKGLPPTPPAPNNPAPTPEQQQQLDQRPINPNDVSAGA